MARPTKIYDPFVILTTRDYRDVNKAVFRARERWKPLGMELGLQPSDLAGIRGDDSECLEQVLSIWLRRRSLEPNFANLVATLRDEIIDHKDVADNIVQEYLGGVDPADGRPSVPVSADPNAIKPSGASTAIMAGKLGRKPEPWELEYLQNPSGTKPVMIIERLQGRWQELIGHLRLPSHTIAGITAMPAFSPSNACRKIFRNWLEGGDEVLSPKNWDMLIQVTKRMDNAALGEEIYRIVAGQQ